MINRNSLLLKLALGIASASLFTSLVAGTIFREDTYESVHAYSLAAVEQIQLTVSNTAAIASYLDDLDLAQEVILGLEKNNIIHSAQITSENVVLASSKDFKVENALEYELKNPFLSGEIIGMIYIVPNSAFIETRAKKIANNNFATLLINTLVVTLLSIIIAFFLVTRPFVKLTQQLIKILPGKSDRIDKVNWHANDEIGLTIHNINQLLDKTQSLFQNEVRLRSEVEQLQKRFEMLFENAKSSILLAKTNGDIIMINQSANTLLTAIGVEYKNNFNDMLNDIFIYPNQLIELVKVSLDLNEVAQGEFKLKNHNSPEEYWIQVFILLTKDENNERYLQIFINDISARKAEIKQLSIHANYDKLTGLYNRHATERIIEQMMCEDVNLAILIIDLNDFKPINDTYGHEAGDLILKHISEQFNSSLRKGDIAGRWGGDEFVICLKQVNQKNVSHICDKLLKQINQMVDLPGTNIKLQVGASIGISFYPQDAETLTEMISLADQAMYRVKKSINKHNFNFYDPH